MILAANLLASTVIAILVAYIVYFFKKYKPFKRQEDAENTENTSVILNSQKLTSVSSTSVSNNVNQSSIGIGNTQSVKTLIKG
jgi:uncharacterized membrane protein YraQ (UPF0718 family)